MLTLINGILCNLPLMGISAFTKLFSHKTNREIISKALNFEQSPNTRRQRTASLVGSIGLQPVWTFVVLLLVLVGYSTTQASMYVCCDKSGGMSFTNAPGGSNCKPYTMQKLEKRPPPALSRLTTLTPPRRRVSALARYDQEIWRYSRRYNIDPSLIKAIIHTESYFDCQAVSTAGAQGLMQLMPETARDLRVANPFNPKENIDGGTRYFRKIMDSFNGDLILSLAAYNAGPGLVKRTGGVPRIPETLRYVNKVLKQYKLYKATW